MKCALCREAIEGEAVRFKGKDYCCEACAFDASLRIGSMCGSQSSVETGMRFERARAVGPATGTEQPRACTIAVDGPVAVGKSSVGRMLASRLGCSFIDTGAMYRALTWQVLHLGMHPDDSDGLTRLAGEASIDMFPDESRGNGYRVAVDGQDVTDEIRKPEVERAVSFVSRVPGVRRALVQKQQHMARGGGAVVVGRDIGTVVLPDASLKVFLTASAEERARRRYRELLAAGKEADEAAVLRELQQRDVIDSTREDSPLRPASDSVTIDTTSLTLEQVVDRIQQMAQERRCL